MSETGRRRRLLAHAETEVRPFIPVGLAGTGTDPVALALAQAREQGLAEGRRQAAVVFDQEVAEQRRRMAESLAAIAGLESRLIREKEAVLLRIALEVGSRIARERIEAGDPVAVRALKEALDALPTTLKLRVRLHPADLAAVESELVGEISRGHLELLPDETVQPGGCILSGAGGTVDATLDAVTEAIHAAALGGPEES
ncbi:MAG TPA: FliH/SctL family protein [Candidatus Polarisedimenticolia bacterium]|nr:FliH/SctL family protein [Candidatus Polarisedimenticolia bacterium]